MPDPLTEEEIADRFGWLAEAQPGDGCHVSKKDARRLIATIAAQRAQVEALRNERYEELDKRVQQQTFYDKVVDDIKAERDEARAAIAEALEHLGWDMEHSHVPSDLPAKALHILGLMNDHIGNANKRADRAEDERDVIRVAMEQAYDEGYQAGWDEADGNENWWNPYAKPEEEKNNSEYETCHLCRMNDAVTQDGVCNECAEKYPLNSAKRTRQ